MIDMTIPKNVEQFLRTLFPDIDKGNEEHVGCYCLKLTPITCSCGEVQEFFEPDGYHMVVVWAQKDDPVLLSTAAGAMKIGRDAKIVEYKVDYGPSLEFYEAFQDGLFPIT